MTESRTVGVAAQTADLNMQAEIASRRQASLLADILSLLCKSKGPASFVYKAHLL